MTIHLAIFVSTVLLTSNAFAQVLNNNGSVGTVSSGTVVSGGTLTNTSGTIANDGTITMSADYTNAGTTSGNGSYNIGGNWSNTGTFTAGTSTVTFNGGSAQTIGGSAASTFNNLTINNSAGVSITSAQNLSGSLSISSGVFTTTGQTFTLLSTSTATARIADLTGGGSITGDITMQRFTLGSGAGTNYTGWAFIGSPVSGRTLADWDDDILIYCNSGCPDGSGFTSIYTYLESTTGIGNLGFVSLNNISDAIAIGEGRWVYLGNGYPVAGDITIDVSGPPVTGDQTLPITYTDDPGVGASEDGWNLIANPYPSPISWTSLEANASTPANIDNAIYVFNADLNGGTGDYATYTIGGISSPSVGSGGIGDNIPSSQGFYVHLIGNTTLQAKESHKTNAQPTFLKTTETESIHTLFRLALDGAPYHTETVIQFLDSATIGFDGNYDAYKLFSDNPLAPSICTKMNNEFYAINSLPSSTDYISVPVRTKAGVAQAYTISLIQDDPSTLLTTCLMLEDLELDTITNLKDTSYTFNLPALGLGDDPAPRFNLHIFTDSVPLIACEIHPVNISKTSLLNQINAYINQHQLIVNFKELEEANLDINIYNMLGQHLLNINHVNTKNKLSIPLPSESKGIYIVEFVGAKSRFVKKLADF